MSVDLIIGGASKSGTTALYDMLSSHPAFYLPLRKELHYFSLPYLRNSLAGPGDAAVVSEIPRSLAEYFRHFRAKDAHQIAVDISPSYLFHYASAQQIANDLPEAKVLFILRKPEEKVFSQYVHLVGEGRETLSFEDALAAEKNRKVSGFSDMWLYEESGFYAKAIKAFQNTLSPQNVKIILFDDFRINPTAILREICEFVELDGTQTFKTNLESNVSGSPRSMILAKIMAPSIMTNLLRRLLPVKFGQWARKTLRTVNTGAKPRMLSTTRAALQIRFAEDISKLEDLIERKTGW